MRRKVKFWFKLNGNTWSWDKEFHTDNINKTIQGYLEDKRLPFDIEDKNIVEFKIIA